MTILKITEAKRFGYFGANKEILPGDYLVCIRSANVPRAKTPSGQQAKGRGPTVWLASPPKCLKDNFTNSSPSLSPALLSYPPFFYPLISPFSYLGP